MRLYPPPFTLLKVKKSYYKIGIWLTNANKLGKYKYGKNLHTYYVSCWLSFMCVNAEIYQPGGQLERTCEGEVAVSKCEGSCISRVRPSAISHTGFYKVHLLLSCTICDTSCKETAGEPGKIYSFLGGCRKKKESFALKERLEFKNFLLCSIFLCFRRTVNAAVKLHCGQEPSHYLNVTTLMGKRWQVTRRIMLSNWRNQRTVNVFGVEICPHRGHLEWNFDRLKRSEYGC